MGEGAEPVGEPDIQAEAERDGESETDPETEPGAECVRASGCANALESNEVSMEVAFEVRGEAERAGFRMAVFAQGSGGHQQVSQRGLVDHGRVQMMQVHAEGCGGLGMAGCQVRGPDDGD